MQPFANPHGQLVATYASDLLQSDEFERFSTRTRATIESVAKEFGRYTGRK